MFYWFWYLQDIDSGLLVVCIKISWLIFMKDRSDSICSESNSGQVLSCLFACLLLTGPWLRPTIIVLKQIVKSGASIVRVNWHFQMWWYKCVFESDFLLISCVPRGDKQGYLFHLGIALWQTCLFQAVYNLIFITRKGLLSRKFFPHLSKRKHFVSLMQVSRLWSILTFFCPLIWPTNFYLKWKFFSQ